MKGFINWLKKPSSDRTLLFILLVLLNLVSARSFIRFDLTAQKSYSISKASKDVVKHIDSPLSIKVFFSKNLTAPYNNVEQYLTDILSEYKANASKNFSYQFFDMSKEENQRIASELGLNPVQIDILETQGFSSKIAWMGVAITYGDYIAALDGLKITADLEYKITTTISKIISTQSTNSQTLYEIGYIVGHNENPLRTNPYAQSYSDIGSGNFYSLISDIYSVKEINLANQDIPSQLKAIIINGPKTEIAEAELKKIDEFIMKGGNILLFADALNEFYPDQESASVFIENNSGIIQLLEKYGIKIDSSFVMDKKCYSQNQSGMGKQYLNWVPLVEKDNTAKKHPVTENLGGILFFCNSPIDITEAEKNKNLSTTVLARSSQNSWRVKDNILLYPNYIVPPESNSDYASENLAVLAEGNFTSPYTSETGADSKIIIVGSSIITTDVLINREGTEPIAMFVRNAVDFVSENEDFCNMRTKGARLDFISIKSDRSAVLVKVLNEIGLSVVVILIGFIVWRMRAARKFLIHQKYNPEDTRVISKKTKETENDN